MNLKAMQRQHIKLTVLIDKSSFEYSIIRYILIITTSGKIVDVLISVDTCDSNLAYQLKNYLHSKGITSYLFDHNKQHDSTLHNKITNVINDSQTLVAIITKEMSSPSVHEEIGYALGKEKSLIVMLEEDTEYGVLSHEHKKELFTKECFEQSCSTVRDHASLNAVNIEYTDWRLNPYDYKNSL